MNPPFSADEHHILHAWAIALNARVARIKGLVLPEKLRRKSTRTTKR
jgi:hypothetical protein